MMKWYVKEMIHRKFGLWFVPSAKTDKLFHALMLTQSELGSQEAGKHRYHLGNCTTNSSKRINLKMSSAKGWGFCSNIYVSIWYPLPTNHLIYMVWSNKKTEGLGFTEKYCYHYRYHYCCYHYCCYCFNYIYLPLSLLSSLFLLWYQHHHYHYWPTYPWLKSLRLLKNKSSKWLSNTKMNYLISYNRPMGAMLSADLLSVKCFIWLAGKNTYPVKS